MFHYSKVWPICLDCITQASSPQMQHMRNDFETEKAGLDMLKELTLGNSEIVTHNINQQSYANKYRVLRQ